MTFSMRLLARKTERRTTEKSGEAASEFPDGLEKVFLLRIKSGYFIGNPLAKGKAFGVAIPAPTYIHDNIMRFHVRQGLFGILLFATASVYHI